MKEKLEQYIKDLPPELQEKARACNSLNEVMELAAENDIELPEDALEMVAGGCGDPCPMGGDHDWRGIPGTLRMRCIKCRETKSKI